MLHLAPDRPVPNGERIFWRRSSLAPPPQIAGMTVTASLPSCLLWKTGPCNAVGAGENAGCIRATGGFASHGPSFEFSKGGGGRQGATPYYHLRNLGPQQPHQKRMRTRSDTTRVQPRGEPRRRGCATAGGQHKEVMPCRPQARSNGQHFTRGIWIFRKKGVPTNGIHQMLRERKVPINRSRRGTLNGKAIGAINRRGIERVP